MFVQHLAGEALQMAKVERKPRRNIQYKDLGKRRHFSHTASCARVSRAVVPANAVAHRDNLEFLEDVIPKTVPYKNIKGQAAATRARLQCDRSGDGDGANGMPNGKKRRSSLGRPSLNGAGDIAGLLGGNSARNSEEDGPADPNDQLQMEAGQVQGDRDVDMIG